MLIVVIIIIVRSDLGSSVTVACEGSYSHDAHTSNNTSAIRSQFASLHVGRIRADRQCVARPHFVLARKSRANLAQRRAPCRGRAPSVGAPLASDPAAQTGDADEGEEGIGEDAGLGEEVQELRGPPHWGELVSVDTQLHSTVLFSLSAFSQAPSRQSPTA